MTRHLLVLKQSGYSLSVPLPDAFRKYAPEVEAEQADPTSETLDDLAKRGYDAVLCWADRAEELDLVVRIRKKAPQIPILVVSSGDAAFRRDAVSQGAAAVLPNSRNVPGLVGLIRQAVELQIAASETKAMAAQNKALTQEVRNLAEKTHLHSQDAWRRMQNPFRTPLLPLLVCDDPDQASQMVRAFEQAGTHASLPILRTGEEAIDYLAGAAPYDNRARHPMPSLVLLDLHGDRKSGLSVLGWMRQQRQLQHLPVIMLSAAIKADDIKQAYGVQANSYLIKPANFDELVEMVKAIDLYWSSLNIRPEP